MTNTIFDVINSLYKELMVLGLPIYKEVKKAGEQGSCIVLSYMPIYKNNVNSINDIVIFIYLKKINGYADSAKISKYCLDISEILTNFKADKGMINFNLQEEPITDNMSEDYTVTTYTTRTINS